MKYRIGLVGYSASEAFTADRSSYLCCVGEVYASGDLRHSLQITEITPLHCLICPYFNAGPEGLE
jgi:hypothetical protein